MDILKQGAGQKLRLSVAFREAVNELQNAAFEEAIYYGVNLQYSCAIDLMYRIRHDAQQFLKQEIPEVPDEHMPLTYRDLVSAIATLDHWVVSTLKAYGVPADVVGQVSPQPPEYGITNRRKDTVDGIGVELKGYLEDVANRWDGISRWLSSQQVVHGTPAIEPSRRRPGTGSTQGQVAHLKS